MLTSLFGDLGAARVGGGRARGRRDPEFAATAILDTVASEVNARGQIIDRHSRDLVVSGSPAQAIRAHFDATRADLDTASAMITLLDPVGVWASAVIKALSDAGGQPIERLHLREQTTLRTLAMIERTTLVRRHEETLRIVHADVREPGSDNAEIPVALMERSQMTTVVIGPLTPRAIDVLLATLLHAAMLPTWRCPALLFLLPPNAVWIANKINAVAWPARLRVHALAESITGASAVWNAMLGMWNQIKRQPGWEPSLPAPLAANDDAPPKFRDLGALGRAPAPDEPAQITRVTRAPLDPAQLRTALGTLRTMDGLLGCAVIDGLTGLVLAANTGADDEAAFDADRAAAAAAQVMRAHRRGADAFGLTGPIDEVVTDAGARRLLIRAIAPAPPLFVVALLDLARATDLEPLRRRLIEFEQHLG